MQEVKINIQDALKGDFKNNMGDGGSCAESEPFALQVIDDSMEPEFAKGCIIIIDPTGVVRDGSYVFARDLGNEYIFRQVLIRDGKYILTPTNEKYKASAFEIPGIEYIEGVITQRAGKKRSYHKFYD